MNTKPKFDPPAGSTFYFGRDADGNDASFILPASTGGTNWFDRWAPDGSPYLKTPVCYHQVGRAAFALTFWGIMPDPKETGISPALYLISRDQFPLICQFWASELDVPIVQTEEGWFNWFGGKDEPFNPSLLRVDNSEEVSFEEFKRLVVDSVLGRL